MFICFKNQVNWSNFDDFSFICRKNILYNISTSNRVKLITFLGTFENFPRIWYSIKLKPQYRGYKHMVDFTNRFLYPEWVYGQTLWGYVQSGNDFKEFIMNMTVNGFLNIQKFKFRKLMIMMTEASYWWIFSIWVL